MGSGPNWYQIGNKTWYIPKVSKFSVEKRHVFMLTGLKGPLKLSLEGLEMQK